MSTTSGLQLEEFEHRKVTHKATEKNGKKVENDKAESTEAKVESVKPPSPFP